MTCPLCQAAQQHSGETKATIAKAAAAAKVLVTPPIAKRDIAVVGANKTVVIGANLVTVKAGQNVEGSDAINRLEKAGVPMLRPDQVDGLVTCPCCSHVFDPTALATAETPQAA